MSLTISLAQSSGTVQIYSVEWSRDGSRFVTVTSEGLTIYDSSFAVLAYQAFPTNFAFQIPSAALSTNGERIYVGSRKVNPAIIDTAPLQQYCDAIWTASVCETHVILDTENLELVVNLSDISVLPHTAQWSADGLSIAFRSEDDRSTIVYSTVDGTLLQSFSPPPLIWGIGYEGGVEWSPNNLYFARVGGDQIFILDASTGQIVSQYQFEAETILDLMWSPDSAYIAILTTADVAFGTPGSFSDPNAVNGARRNSIIVFDPSNSAVVSQISESVVSLSTALSWSPDGSQIAAEGGRGRIYIWDSITSDLLDSFQAPPYFVQNLSYSPYGGRLMVAQNTAAPIPNIDPDFVPISSYAQAEFGGVVQFVAPSASVEKLSAILADCAANSEIVTTGLAFLTTQQYSEFTDWVNQQPSSAIPEICAADLLIIALTIMDNQPSPMATFTLMPTETVTETPTAAATSTSTPTLTSTPIPTATPSATATQPPGPVGGTGLRGQYHDNSDLTGFRLNRVDATVDVESRRVPASVLRCSPCPG